MGRGDRRTRKGKIWRGSSGVTRPRKKKAKEKSKGRAKAAKRSEPTA